MVHRRRVPALLGLCVLAPLLGLQTACSTLGMGSSTPVVDRIEKTGELRVGTTGDSPPFNMTDRRGEVIGLEADLARALAQTLDAKLVIVRKPFAELLPALEKGEVDIVMAGMTMTPKRNLQVAFVGPYFVSGKAILTKSSTLARAENMNALDRAQVRIAVLDGSTSQMFAKSSAPNANLIAIQSYDEGVRMVDEGRADVLLADYPVCVLTVLRNPGKGFATVVSPFSFEPIGMAVPAGDPLFLNLVENYVHTLEGTGLLDQLRKRWFEDPSWVAELP